MFQLRRRRDGKGRIYFVASVVATGCGNPQIISSEYNPRDDSVFFFFDFGAGTVDGFFLAFGRLAGRRPPMQPTLPLAIYPGDENIGDDKRKPSGFTSNTG